MRLWVPSHSNATVPSSTKEKLQLTPVQRLKGGNATTGQPTGRLVTCPRGLNITFKPQCKDKRTANLTTNCGKKMDMQKMEKGEYNKYATWNVRGIAHK
jgi:hypothetical protein